MTKCKRQYRKADKLSIRKKNQIKYEYLHSNDHIQASEECENTKIKTLSKQQYRRLKNENRKKSNSQTSSNGSMKSISSNNDTKFSIERPVLPESARCQALQKQSESDFSTPPLSAKSFHVNADWSEFEEREHFQFVSEHQIDISRVLGHFFDANVPKMKQPDSRFEIDHTVATSESEASELDGLLTPLEPMNEECEGPLTPTGDRDDRGHCGLWAMELSQARLERMQQDLQDVAMPVKQQATDILRLFDSSRPPFSVEEESKWSSVLTKLADMGITCSAMHCLLQDFIMQEDSELLQEQLVQWIQIGSSCSELLAVAKTAGDVSHSSVFFLESLSLLRQLWSSDHRQTIGEQQQHCEVLVTAMKRMVGSMRIEYTKLQSACSKIFPDLENESVPFLNDVEKAISRLEMNYTMSDEKKLVKLLNLNFKETSKEIKQFSGGKVPKPNGEIPHSVTCSSPSLFFRIPLKVMLLLLMSIVCLFGSSELETQQFASPEYNSTDVNSVEAMITQELLRLHNRFSTEK